MPGPISFLPAALNRLREQAKMSQQELATKAGLSVSVVSRLEQGKIPDPRMSTIAALADALGVDCRAFQQPPAAPRGKPAKRSRG